MRVTMRAVFDMESMALIEWQGYEYSGPVEYMKHSTEKAKADAAQARNDAMQQKAFDSQQKTLADIKSSFGKYLDGKQGFDPAQLAALKTQFLAGNAKQFNSARSGVMSALASRGGVGQPAGGDVVRGLSGLYGSEASNLSSGLTGIKLQDLSQALTNQFNTGSLLSGNAATLNSPISTFGSGASNALNQRIQVGMQPGFFSQLGTSLAGGLGAGLGAGLTGGLGGVLGGLGKAGAGFASATGG